MIIEFWCKNMKNYFKDFEPKWPRNLKNGQMRNFIEFFKGFKYFYQKLYIKIKLRVKEFSKTELQSTFFESQQNQLIKYVFETWKRVKR